MLVQEIFPGKELQGPELSENFELSISSERKRPYNFDLNVDSDGKCKTPRSFGGIMREVSYFKLLLPISNTLNSGYHWFIYNSNGTNKGGDLYFNLGSISKIFFSDSKIV